MATLVGNVNSTAADWTVSEDISHAVDYLSIDSETVQILTHTPTRRDPQTLVTLPPRISVRRAAGGTNAASHTSGATLTSVIPPGASGGASGVTVDNQDDPPAAVTTLIAPGATIAGNEANLSALEGTQRIRLLGPFTIAHDTAGLPVDGISLAELPEGALLIGLYALRVEDWDQPTLCNLGFGFDDANPEVPFGPVVTYRIYDLATGSVIGVEHSLNVASSESFIHIIGSDPLHENGTTLWVAADPDGDPATTGETDIYALIAEPAA